MSNELIVKKWKLTELVDDLQKIGCVIVEEGDCCKISVPDKHKHLIQFVPIPEDEYPDKAKIVFSGNTLLKVSSPDIIEPYKSKIKEAVLVQAEIAQLRRGEDGSVIIPKNEEPLFVASMHNAIVRKKPKETKESKRDQVRPQQPAQGLTPIASAVIAPEIIPDLVQQLLEDRTGDEIEILDVPIGTRKEISEPENFVEYTNLACAQYGIDPVITYATAKVRAKLLAEQNKEIKEVKRTARVRKFETHYCPLLRQVKGDAAGANLAFVPLELSRHFIYLIAKKYEAIYQQKHNKEIIVTLNPTINFFKFGLRGAVDPGFHPEDDPNEIREFAQFLKKYGINVKIIKVPKAILFGVQRHANAIQQGQSRTAPQPLPPTLNYVKVSIKILRHIFLVVLNLDIEELRKKHLENKSHDEEWECDELTIALFNLLETIFAALSRDEPGLWRGVFALLNAKHIIFQVIAQFVVNKSSTKSHIVETTQFTDLLKDYENNKNELSEKLALLDCALTPEAENKVVAEIEILQAQCEQLLQQRKNILADRLAINLPGDFQKKLKIIVERIDYAFQPSEELALERSEEQRLNRRWCPPSAPNIQTHIVGSTTHPKTNVRSVVVQQPTQITIKRPIFVSVLWDLSDSILSGKEAMLEEKGQPVPDAKAQAKTHVTNFENCREIIPDIFAKHAEEGVIYHLLGYGGKIKDAQNQDGLSNLVTDLVKDLKAENPDALSQIKTRLGQITPGGHTPMLAALIRKLRTIQPNEVHFIYPLTDGGANDIYPKNSKEQERYKEHFSPELQEHCRYLSEQEQQELLRLQKLRKQLCTLKIVWRSEQQQKIFMGKLHLALGRKIAFFDSNTLQFINLEKIPSDKEAVFDELVELYAASISYEEKWESQNKATFIQAMKAFNKADRPFRYDFKEAHLLPDIFDDNNPPLTFNFQLVVKRELKKLADKEVASSDLIFRPRRAAQVTSYSSHREKNPSDLQAEEDCQFLSLQGNQLLSNFGAMTDHATTRRNMGLTTTSTPTPTVNVRTLIEPDFTENPDTGELIIHNPGYEVREQITLNTADVPQFLCPANILLDKDGKAKLTTIVRIIDDGAVVHQIIIVIEPDVIEEALKEKEPGEQLELDQLLSKQFEKDLKRDLAKKGINLENVAECFDPENNNDHSAQLQRVTVIQEIIAGKTKEYENKPKYYDRAREHLKQGKERFAAIEKILQTRKKVAQLLQQQQQEAEEFKKSNDALLKQKAELAKNLIATENEIKTLGSKIDHIIDDPEIKNTDSEIKAGQAKVKTAETALQNAQWRQERRLTALVIRSLETENKPKIAEFKRSELHRSLTAQQEDLTRKLTESKEVKVEAAFLTPSHAVQYIDHFLKLNIHPTTKAQLTQQRDALIAKMTAATEIKPEWLLRTLLIEFLEDYIALGITDTVYTGCLSSCKTKRDALGDNPDKVVAFKAVLGIGTTANGRNRYLYRKQGIIYLTHLLQLVADKAEQQNLLKLLYALLSDIREHASVNECSKKPSEGFFESERFIGSSQVDTLDKQLQQFVTQRGLQKESITYTHTGSYRRRGAADGSDLPASLKNALFQNPFNPLNDDINKLLDIPPYKGIAALFRAEIVRTGRSLQQVVLDPDYTQFVATTTTRATELQSAQDALQQNQTRRQDRLDQLVRASNSIGSKEQLAKLADQKAGLEKSILILQQQARENETAITTLAATHQNQKVKTQGEIASALQEYRYSTRKYPEHELTQCYHDFIAAMERNLEFCVSLPMEVLDPPKKSPAATAAKKAATQPNPTLFSTPIQLNRGGILALDAKDAKADVTSRVAVLENQMGQVVDEQQKMRTELAELKQDIANTCQIATKEGITLDPETLLRVCQHEKTLSQMADQIEEDKYLHEIIFRNEGDSLYHSMATILADGTFHGSTAVVSGFNEAGTKQPIDKLAKAFNIVGDVLPIAGPVAKWIAFVFKGASFLMRVQQGISKNEVDKNYADFFVQAREPDKLLRRFNKLLTLGRHAITAENLRKAKLPVTGKLERLQQCYAALNAAIDGVGSTHPVLQQTLQDWGLVLAAIANGDLTPPSLAQARQMSSDDYENEMCKRMLTVVFGNELAEQLLANMNPVRSNAAGPSPSNHQAAEHKHDTVGNNSRNTSSFSDSTPDMLARLQRLERNHEDLVARVQAPTVVGSENGTAQAYAGVAGVSNGVAGLEAVQHQVNQLAAVVQQASEAAANAQLTAELLKSKVIVPAKRVVS